MDPITLGSYVFDPDCDVLIDNGHAERGITTVVVHDDGSRTYYRNPPGWSPDLQIEVLHVVDGRTVTYGYVEDRPDRPHDEACDCDGTGCAADVHADAVEDREQVAEYVFSGALHRDLAAATDPRV